MTQTYQMKHNPQGTIYSLLTVESNGQMTMTFHGTDREICHEANVTEGGRITTGGSLFPGLESGKWQAVDDVQGTVPAVGSEAESERTTEGLSPMCAEPRPRRQRKPRKPRVALDGRTAEHTSAISHQTIPADAPTRSLSDIDRQPSATLKAVGMVAAATVVLFVIYETGLLIPMGLIGLATGGILK